MHHKKVINTKNESLENFINKKLDLLPENLQSGMLNVILCDKIKKGALEQVKFIMSKYNVDLTSKYEDRYTPIAVAAIYKKWNIVNFLSELIPDNKNGEYQAELALVLAVDSKQRNTINKLLNISNISKNTVDNKFYIRDMMRTGSTSHNHMMNDYGYYFSKINNKNNKGVAECLLKLTGSSPLYYHRPLYHNREDIYPYKGAAISQNTENIALIFAVANNDIDIVSDLIKHGFQVNQTIHVIALYYQSPDRKYGEDHIGRFFDINPIGIALKNKNFQMVSLLLKHGAQLNRDDYSKYRELLSRQASFAP